MMDSISDQEEKTREFEYKETKWSMKCEDPYGFWTVNYKDGRTPEALGGKYTSYIQAEKDIAKYIEGRGIKQMQDKKSGRGKTAPDMEA